MTPHAQGETACDGTDAARRIDEFAGRLHAQSLESLSPRTLARLRAARHASASTAHSPRTAGWWMAGGCTAVVAVAMVVVALQDRSADAPPPRFAAAAPIEELHAAGLGDEYRHMVAGLDENPELYVWLASNQDALALTTGTPNR